jgi:cytidylate kinase
MATAQQKRKFTDEEAERFAALMAGFDTGNPSEAEAISKGRVMRRMAAEKNIRLVDAWELPEIREAVDRQLQPVRAAVRIVKEVQVVNEDCRCAPWPVQMFWFFVGLLAWMVTGYFWLMKQAGLFVIAVAEEMQRRKRK